MQVKAYENFCENVKAAMAKKGISVRELASTLGTSHPYLSRTLNGLNMPSIDRCEQIADALGTKLSILIGESREKISA